MPYFVILKDDETILDGPYDTKEEAAETIARYYEDDKESGTYTPGIYSVDDDEDECEEEDDEDTSDREYEAMMDRVYDDAQWSDE